METSKCSDSPGLRWWETPGSLRVSVPRLDGRVGVVVNAERQVVDPGVVERQGGVLGFGSVRSGFTRVAGLFRRQAPPHAVREAGEWTDEQSIRQRP